MSWFRSSSASSSSSSHEPLDEAPPPATYGMPLVGPLYGPPFYPLDYIGMPGSTPEEKESVKQAIRYQKGFQSVPESCLFKTGMAGVAGESFVFVRALALRLCSGREGRRRWMNYEVHNVFDGRSFWGISLEHRCLSAKRTGAFTSLVKPRKSERLRGDLSREYETVLLWTASLMLASSPPLKQVSA